MGKTDFTVAELVAKAESLVDQCQLELAVRFYERALIKEPTNTTLLDVVGELSTEMDNPVRALSAFQKSVQLAPAQNPSKWLYLAQLVPGQDAEQYSSQGIKYLRAELDKLPAESDEATVIKKQIGDAFCAMGELYMTDLCDEDDAEARCEQYYAEAMKFDVGLPETTQALANLRLTQQRKEEAVPLLEETYRRLSENCDENSLPSLEFRIYTGKLLIEVELYEQACDVLEGVMQEDDDNAEIWFLVATCYRAMDDLTSSLEFFQKCEAMLKKLKQDLRHEFHLNEQLESVEAAVIEVQQAIANRGSDDDGDDDDDDDECHSGEEGSKTAPGTEDVEMEE